MKVLVTGGGGFIGRYCLKQLVESGYEVFSIYKSTYSEMGGVKFLNGDLLDTRASEEILRKVRPSHLLHLAWTTEHGLYWEDPKNSDWVNASIALLEKFNEWGGERAVIAGTCAEYDWSYKYCDENLTPTSPSTLYGRSKLELQEKLTLASKKITSNIAFGRIFSLYGPYESPKRLVSNLICRLMDGREAACNNPNLIRDYLHVEDVASGFVALLEAELKGAVNIGSGHGISLGNLALKIAEKLNASDCIKLGGKMLAEDSQDELIANPSKLMSTGWIPKYGLDDGLDDTINWWKINR